MHSTIAVLLLFAATVEAAPDHAQGPFTLTASSTKSLGVPTGSFSRPIQCDAKGNLYFNAGNTHESAIFEARSDGSHFMYGLSGENVRDYDFVSYRVNADGKMWLLVRDKSDQPHLFQFRDDATTPIQTKLDAPEQMPASTVYNFIKLENGHVVLQGYTKAKSDKDGGSRSYLAEYDASGMLVRKSLEKGRGIDITRWPPSTAAAQGDDGSIYILEPEKVVVLSPGGEVAREIKLVPPESDYLPYLLYFAGGRLAVGYSKAGDPPVKLKTLYAILDASTGQQLRLYQASAELGNALVCYSSEGFTFYRVDHGRIKLVTASAN